MKKEIDAFYAQVMALVDAFDALKEETQETIGDNELGELSTAMAEVVIRTHEPQTFSELKELCKDDVNLWASGLYYFFDLGGIPAENYDLVQNIGLENVIDNVTKASVETPEELVEWLEAAERKRIAAARCAHCGKPIELEEYAQSAGIAVGSNHDLHDRCVDVFRRRQRTR